MASQHSQTWIKQLTRNDLDVVFEALMFRIEAETSKDEITRKYYSDRVKQMIASSTNKFVANRIMSIPVHELEAVRMALWERLADVVSVDGEARDDGYVPSDKPPMPPKLPLETEIFAKRSYYGPPPKKSYHENEEVELTDTVSYGPPPERNEL